MANYINNKEFYALLQNFKEDCKEAEENGKPAPRVPEDIGKCFMMIATKLATKANFSGYTYKDEMICDALENCVVAVHSFNPEKSSNPFSYFTQVIYFAFLRRIAKEKKQSYIKGKLIHDMAFDTFEIQDHDDDAEFKNAFAEFMKAHSTFDDSFVKNKEKKKKVKEEQSLENFIEEEPNE